ncbi:hypothetical protein NA78x_003121 [Anatilimnocola sp. NA78]|uniref:hypothetical protein n=1 Tax=Anatilimnocola sp. NA78 TaxID=3415683 RepID=UPI003CE4FD42
MSTTSATTAQLRTVTLRVTIVLLVVVVAVAFVAVRWHQEPAVTIGVEGKRTLEIVGPQLIAAPFTPGDALSVRIAGIEPTATGFRYDIRYMAFGPGEHDIGKSLVRPDGKPPPLQPEFAVSVAALLPETYSGELYATRSSPIDLHTNYTVVMTLAWGLWALLLVPLIWYGTQWRGRTSAAPPAPSISERLRLLLKQAATADLTAEQQADLEQLLLAFWSQRLNLSQQRLSETIQQLRRHPQAGPQWNSVERWFHSRSTPVRGTASKQLLQELEALR